MDLSPKIIFFIRECVVQLMSESAGGEETEGGGGGDGDADGDGDVDMEGLETRGGGVGDQRENIQDKGTKEEPYESETMFILSSIRLISP